VNGLRQQFDGLQFDELGAGADMVAVPSLRAPGIDLQPGYSSEPAKSSNRSTEFRSRVRRVVFHAQACWVCSAGKSGHQAAASIGVLGREWPARMAHLYHAAMSAFATALSARGRSTFIAFRFAMTRSVAAGSCRSGSVTSSLCVFQREMCAIENVTQTPPKSREDL
jgi:hypothetical protein